MSTMTLQQLRDAIAAQCNTSGYAASWLDALDSHLAGPVPRVEIGILSDENPIQRARTTYRREQAVDTLLAMGWKWDHVTGWKAPWVDAIDAEPVEAVDVTDAMVVAARDGYLAAPEGVNPMRCALEAAEHARKKSKPEHQAEVQQARELLNRVIVPDAAPVGQVLPIDSWEAIARNSVHLMTNARDGHYTLDDAIAYLAGALNTGRDVQHHPFDLPPPIINLSECRARGWEDSALAYRSGWNDCRRAALGEEPLGYVGCHELATSVGVKS